MGGGVNCEGVRKSRGICGVVFESRGVYLVDKGWSMVKDLIKR